MLTAIDQHLIPWKKDKNSFYYQRLSKWLGVGTATRSIIPGWLLGTFAAMTGVALLLVAMSLYLKREVARRTRELMKSENRFRLAIMSAPFPVMLHADDDEVLMINDVWTELTGYTQSDTPTTKEWSRRAYGDVSETVNKAIAELYSLQTRQDEGEFPVTAKNGEQLIWSFSSAPLGQMEDGRRLVISMAMDVTKQKQAESEIYQLHADLEKRVVERTAQLEAANKELEAFSYSVSHDLRAPLRHIDGYVDLLVSRCRDELSAKGRHYVDTIADSARRAGVLIDDLLHFSRTGRLEMKKVTVDTNRLLRAALDALKTSQADRSIEWVIEELPSVQADEALLRQVWANLLDNAIKYTRTRTHARIEVSARNEAGEVQFIVKDNGVGFDMQYSGKLFGVFQRLHANEEFEGTGIGLATVQRILHRHGGRIWVEAELDRGATFIFTLPNNNGAKS